MAADPVGDPPYYWPYHNGWLMNEVKNMGMGAAKGYTTFPDYVLDELENVLIGEKLFVHRLPIWPDDNRDIDHLLNIYIPHIKRMVARGHTYLEPHNEPNLYREGLGKWYGNGEDYASWLLALSQAIRGEVPEVKIGFPAMSPGPLNEQRVNEDVFVAEMRRVIDYEDFDWISLHTYWLNSAGINDAVRRVHKHTVLFPNHPVMVTEFGNLSQEAPEVKGEQYVEWYETIPDLHRNLTATFLWVLWASSGFDYDIVAGTPVVEMIAPS